MALNASPPCRDLQILLVLPAVPLIHLHSPYLQLGEGLFPLSSVISGVSSGPTLDRLHCASPIWSLLEDCQLEVSTDASDMGWGIYVQGKLLQGLWTSVADAPAHINAKELMVLLIFLEDYLPQCVDPLSLLWRTDSLTSKAYIRREGGTVSRPLL